MSRPGYVVLVAGLAAVLLAASGTAEQEPGRPAESPYRLAAWQASGAAPVATAFTPVAPVRVLDTRTGTGTGGSTAPVGIAGTVTVDLSSRVPTSAKAVVLNVTGTEPTAETFVTVYPAGTPKPAASNLNLVPGQTRPNAVTVELPADRRVTLYNNFGTTHLIADLTGYYATGTGSLFTAQSPARVLDTRTGGPVGPAASVSVSFPGLPATATAVTFNLTGVDATANTFVTAFPSGTARPLASNLNLVPGEVAPNQVTVPLGADRRVTLYNNAGNTHLIVDLAGFYATGQGVSFYPVSPFRLWDTRPGKGLVRDFLFRMEIAGLPAATSAVVVNLTGTGPTATTYVVAWPGNDNLAPNSSTLNLVPGQTAANLATVGVASTSDGIQLLDFANFNGYVDLIVDPAGYFAP